MAQFNKRNKEVLYHIYLATQKRAKRQVRNLKNIGHTASCAGGTVWNHRKCCCSAGLKD